MLAPTTPERRTELAGVIGEWIAKCAADGFDAVEIDNLDTFTRSHGLITEDDAVAQMRLFADAAHAVGLPIAQKNSAEIVGQARGDGHRLRRRRGVRPLLRSATPTPPPTATTCWSSSTAAATSTPAAPPTRTCRSSCATWTSCRRARRATCSTSADDTSAPVGQRVRPHALALRLHGHRSRGAGNLVICPVVLGDGLRLFPDQGQTHNLKLLDSRATPSGATIQTYRPAGRATFGNAGE